MRYYLTADNLAETVDNLDVYLFGVGQETRQLMELLPTGTIKGFIDNNKSGCYYRGSKIMRLDEYQRNEHSIIIITTPRYMKDICGQLRNNGFRLGKDFYIWDEECLHHHNSSIDNYIAMNNRLFGSEKVTGSDQMILMACDIKCNMAPTIYGYCANYLAKKYKAKIVGYIRFGNKSSNLSANMRKIYKSINVERIVNYRVTGKKKEEAKVICEKIWDGIRTWEDWKQIEVYGINFGTTIIRTIMRLKVPDFNPKSSVMKDYLLEQMEYIVFWYHFFREHSVKKVLLGDGANWDGYIRDIAVSSGIPAYALESFRKTNLNFYIKKPYEYFDLFWEQLTEEEKSYGISWAQKHLEERVNGSMEDIPNWISPTVYTRGDFSQDDPHICSKKMGVVICPHIFEEDSYQCGEQLFDNNYIAWLNHLGELSEKTDNLNWYLKEHPDSQRLDEIIMDRYLKQYPKIIRLDRSVSPHKYEKLGIKYALTICGSIGHEYPAIGIHVINAGKNPGSKFAFNINPQSKDEYDEIIMNLETYDTSYLSHDDLLKFYCLQYYYYNWKPFDYYSIFGGDPVLWMRKHALHKKGKYFGPWLYDIYLENVSQEEHEQIKKNICKVFSAMDDWRPDFFYRKH